MGDHSVKPMAAFAQKLAVCSTAYWAVIGELWAHGVRLADRVLVAASESLTLEHSVAVSSSD